MPRKNTTTAEFAAASTEAHGGRYSYDCSVVTRLRDPVNIRCPVHGVVTVSRAETHMRPVQGHYGGCPKCSHDARRDRLVAAADAVYGADFWDKDAEYRAAVLRDVLDYDPETGRLSWAKAPVSSVRAGDAIDYVDPAGYLRVHFARKLQLAHRVIWLRQTGRDADSVDHVNGIRSDNRLANLRDVDNQTNSENARKARSNSQTGVLGVWPTGPSYKKPWRSAIQSHGRLVPLGTFDTVDEAHSAYLAAKRAIHEGGTL